ncbi:hypothetical protein [Cohnella lupini]|uniref:2'-5' RNA ligase superfamily protein n=1 Tax=Cohnella lupini TaxID=1294267 RepID=A0A3D9I2T9_9BACL|nr:hypothetical protein [Cohnella lupini]RED55960.1 hypothetical protein DFP95_11523 [Cohnella lupini]
MTFEEYSEHLTTLFTTNMNKVPIPWVISNKLSEKITLSGEMKPFYGATTVIKLSEQDKSACIAIRNRLFAKHGNCFAKLETDTYHLTIHALSNVYNVAKDDELIRQRIRDIEPMVEAAFRLFAKQYGRDKIRMKALGVGTSGKDIIGLKYVPCEESDYAILIDLFNILEKVYPLGEFFVPHVSFGYFQIRDYRDGEITALYETLNQLNSEMDLTIELDVSELVYQHHYHMNDFRDIFRVKDY